MPDEVDVALKIGDLLLRSDVITLEALEDAVTLAGKMHMSLGRVLEMQGSMTEYAVACALHIASMIDDQSLSLDHGVKALMMVAKQNIELETALRKVAAPAAKVSKSQTNALASLLSAAGFVTARQLEEGMSQSLNTGLPLGMVLINLNSLTTENLQLALQGLALVKLLGMDKDTCIQVTRLARLRSATLRRSLEMHNLNPAMVDELFSLADLLRMAGFISQLQALSARELSLVSDQPIEEVIGECAYASEIGLAAGAHLMKMIHEGTLATEHAALILKRLKAATTPEEMAQVLANLDEEEELPERSLEMTDLLKLSGVLSEKEVQIATPIALAGRIPLVKTLVDANIISSQTVSLASECKDYLDEGMISLEQAIIALVYAIENSVKFSHALNLFGWSQ